MRFGFSILALIQVLIFEIGCEQRQRNNAAIQDLCPRGETFDDTTKECVSDSTNTTTTTNNQIEIDDCKQNNTCAQTPTPSESDCNSEYKTLDSLGESCIDIADSESCEALDGKFDENDLTCGPKQSSPTLYTENPQEKSCEEDSTQDKCKSEEIETTNTTDTTDTTDTTTEKSQTTVQSIDENDNNFGIEIEEKKPSIKSPEFKIGYEFKLAENQNLESYKFFLNMKNATDAKEVYLKLTNTESITIKNGESAPSPKAVLEYKLGSKECKSSTLEFTSKESKSLEGQTVETTCK